MKREDFLARVRQAANAGRAYRVRPPADLPADVGYVGGGDDPVQRLADEIVLAGGQAQIVDHLPDAANCLGQLIDEYRVQIALCWEHPLLERMGLDALLAARNVRGWQYDKLVALSHAEQRQAMFAADMGISSTTHALAETGTLAVFSGPGRERLATLLPPVHVAIVEASQILPDLFDLFERLDSAGADSLPTNISLITGPSKTGDLELRLTTGVHGPRRWHVIIVRNGAA